MPTTIVNLLAGHSSHCLVDTLLEGQVQRAHHPLQPQLLEPAFGQCPHELDPVQVRAVGHVAQHVDAQPLHHFGGASISRANVVWALIWHASRVAGKIAPWTGACIISFLMLKS